MTSMKRIPRILHLTHEMGIGGTQQVINQLVCNLDNERFDCEICCIDGEVGELGEKLIEKGFKIHCFSRGGGLNLTLINLIRSLLKERSYDLIHCHQYTPFVYGTLSSIFKNVKVVFTEHGRFYPDSYSWKRRLVNPILGRYADSLVSISESTRQALVDYEWFSRKRVKVIYNGLEPQLIVNSRSKVLADWGVPAGSIVIGTIARFDSIKNIPMMIKAFHCVHKTHPHSRLLLVGDGLERRVLEEMVKALRLDDAVIFTGFQSNTADLMSAMDIYLLTSFSEGTSMTLLEAMSSATCSIVTRVGGNVELIENGVSGIVVESGEVDALSKSMDELIDDVNKRIGLANKAKIVFEKKFRLSVMIRRYSALYEEVLNAN